MHKFDRDKKKTKKNQPCLQSCTRKQKELEQLHDTKDRQTSLALCFIFLVIFVIQILHFSFLSYQSNECLNKKPDFQSLKR